MQSNIMPSGQTWHKLPSLTILQLFQTFIVLRVFIAVPFMSFGLNFIFSENMRHSSFIAFSLMEYLSTRLFNLNYGYFRKYLGSKNLNITFQVSSL